MRTNLPAPLGMSEERLRRVIQSDLLGIVSWDDKGVILEANDAFLRFTGYTREELSAGVVRWNDFTPEEFHELDDRAIKELRAQGKCTPFETQGIGKAGRRIPILVGAVVLEGQRDRGVAFVLDLSDLKKAEKEARLYVEQLRKLAEASAQINATLSQERVLQIVTENARKVIGAHLSIITTKKDLGWAQTSSAISFSDTCAAWSGFSLNPASCAALCRSNAVLRLAQSELEAHAHWQTLSESVAHQLRFQGLLVAPLIGRDGSGLGLILLSYKHEDEFSASDEAIVVQLAQMAAVAIENASLYTEVQTSQAVLTQKEKHLRAVIDTTPACVKLISSEGIVLEINSAGAAMLQADEPSDVIGRIIYPFIAPESRDAFRAFNERVCSGQGGLLQYELIGLKGRRLQVEARSACLKRYDGTDVHLSITQDLSERYRLQEQYLQAAKMQAVGRLAGGIAHDFNNLLTVINGYSQVLLGVFKDHEHAKDLLGQILHAGERAASLTQQLLAYSRKQHQFLKVLNLNELLTGTERMLRRMIGEDLELVTSLDSRLLRVKADPSQIDQIMMNLAVNARDAMPQGGTFTIATKNVYLDGTYPSANFKIPRGRYVLLTVSDTGFGMDAATQAANLRAFLYHQRDW